MPKGQLMHRLSVIAITHLFALDQSVNTKSEKNVQVFKKGGLDEKRGEKLD